MSIEHPHITEMNRKGYIGKAPVCALDYFGNEVQEGEKVLYVGEEFALIGEVTANELIQLLTDLDYAEVRDFEA